VEDWAEIRRLHRSEQMAVKAIARRLGLARNTVRSALAADTPPKYSRAPPGPRPARSAGQRARGPARSGPRSVTRPATTPWPTRRGATARSQACVRHDGHRVSQASVLRLLRAEGLILEANYQRERRRPAERRKAAFATEPTGPNEVWQLDFSEFETTTGGTWRDAGCRDYWSKYARRFHRMGGAAGPTGPTASGVAALTPTGAPAAVVLPPAAARRSSRAS